MTHEIKVHRVQEVLPHPNADTLGIVELEGYQCCVRLHDIKAGDLVVYVPPDYVVDSSRPEFAFLGKHTRIKVKKLRGVMSQGLVIKAPDGFPEGADVMEALNIQRYISPIEVTMGDSIPGPSVTIPKYDLESLRKFKDLIQPGEPVVITEKIHGANARYMYHGGTMWAGSRSQWKKDTESCLWYRALRAYPQIVSWCQKYPDHVLFGEVFGQVQDLRYGCTVRNPIFFAAFDVYRPYIAGGSWMGPVERSDLLRSQGVPLVPVVSDGACPSYEHLIQMSERLSHWPGAETQIAEGIVVEPLTPRRTLAGDRVKFKLVSDLYLMQV